MFERPDRGERALLVHPVFQDADAVADPHEFVELAVSAGAEVLDTVLVNRYRPEPKLLIGSGKVDELAARVAEEGVELVLCSHRLSPSQERNLERRLQCRVLDRSGLILDIFAQRARSFEGKLQVELAQLEHLSTRLVRGWTHLERQKGGIGLRGPGETQLETDRRLIRARITKLKARLDKVDRQRELGRQNRLRNDVPTVALVGYTNAGKSTLFNALTAADVYAADQLFATLDPTLRRLELAPRREVVLADTVGFVSDLPHELVAAFKATLTETREADVILHVIDASDPDRALREQQVNKVLEEIGAEDVAQIRVYNKIDVNGQLAHALAGGEDVPPTVFLSALTGAGIDLLLDILADRFREDHVHGRLTLSAREAEERARLFDRGAVVKEHFDDRGDCHVTIDMTKKEFLQFCRQMNVDPQRLQQPPAAGAAQATPSSSPASA